MDFWKDLLLASVSLECVSSNKEGVQEVWKY